MNPIRQLRRRAKLTQAELAQVATTSQSTIAAYETGRKSPTLSTLERLATSVGLEAAVAFVPPLTREERRSLALHRAIAARLAAEPEHVLRVARRNLRRMRSQAGSSSQILDEWRVLLARPLAALLPVLTDPSPWARELRHVTPFAGVLSAAERADVYRAFSEDTDARA